MLTRFFQGLYIYKLLAAKIHKCSVKRNPRKEMNRYYRAVFGRDARFDNPRDLIEKIYWLQLNTDTSLWTKCADKYNMREYVKECGYGDYLPKNYGCWRNVDEISFESLPNEFVFKANNGYGTVLIVHDKTKLDICSTKKVLKQWLSIPFGWAGGQLHYTRIRPCIIAEELLHQDEELNALSPNSLIDYKIWCINGIPESVFVAYNRHDGMSINTALYDTKWNSLSDYLVSTKNDVFVDGVDIPRPSCLDEMIAIAKDLSRPFPEVRVDFYIINKKPIVGELTFTTGFGYFTEEYYNILGDKISLP